MYLRHTTIEKDGKTHTYWRLVRSVRVGKKVRQETVATLGELDEQGRLNARALWRSITGVAGEQLSFGLPTQALAVRVKLSEVRLEQGRRFGDVWLGWTLWRALKLDEWMETHLEVGREQVGWAAMSAILVLARLCEPSSELPIAEDWYRQTALEDLLGVPVDSVNQSRLYRALDKLLPHKEALCLHLRQRLGELFAFEYDLLLYDVTSTYFEGLAEANELAQRGYSRDHRPDCKQVCIALVVTREGMPLAYEVFAGNTVDVTTVESIVESVESKYGKAGRIWVMDRGMVSESNLAFLRKRQSHYVVGTPKSLLRQFEAELKQNNWTEVEPGIAVRLCRRSEDSETFLVCRSQARREKERAIQTRFARRIRAAVKSLERRLGAARQPVSQDEVQRQIGRLLGRNARAASGFDLRVVAAPETPAGIRIQCLRRSSWWHWSRLSAGAYVLRSNVPDLTPQAFWKTYMQLTDAENAFRMQKSDLRLRPIWHQKSERVEAQILVCFLAYLLYKTQEQWANRAGLGKSPQKILEEFRRLQTADVIMPTVDGPEVRIRCVVRPDDAQSILIQRLGLELPQRLRLPPTVKM
jgi:transposase